MTAKNVNKKSLFNRLYTVDCRPQHRLARGRRFGFLKHSSQESGVIIYFCTPGTILSSQVLKVRHVFIWGAFPDMANQNRENLARFKALLVYEDSS